MRGRLPGRRAAHNQGLWPGLLLLVAVLTSTACVLWFMTEAMENRRLVVARKLASAYLAIVQDRLEAYWQQQAAALEKSEAETSGSALFAHCVAEGLADSVVCYDAQGRLLYPAAPQAPERDSGGQQAQWAEALRLEYVEQDLDAAASAYEVMAAACGDPEKDRFNAHLAARALQAQARCLARAGHHDAAIQVFTEILGQEEYRQATDLQGRLIVVGAQLRALQLMGRPSHPGFSATADRLKKRLTDYDDPVLASAQRRFLMKQFQTLLPGDAEFPTLAAEELAARFVEAHPLPSKDSVVRLTELPGVWQLAAPNGRVRGLLWTESVLSRSRAAIAARALPSEASVALVPPGEAPSSEGVFHSAEVGGRLPGWRLTLSPEGGQLFDTAFDERIASYLWTGILVIAAMSILALLVGQAFRRQIRLSRLKNDLVATVSHELKTPLSSIRLLVDTLLDDPELQENKVREYLGLIAKENMRLSRLIDNFLAFSRMERNKHAFEFAEVQPADVVDAAVEVVRERFHAPECRFEVEVAADLPPIDADADAMVTVLLNLLDNAYKHSGDEKQMVLRAYPDKGNVCLEVEDNGIGLSRMAAKKVFKRFYQVDERIARESGGVGLGLSIVEFIVRAHGGAVRVRSQPGRGSTFTVTIPRLSAQSQECEGAKS